MLTVDNKEARVIILDSTGTLLLYTIDCINFTCTQQATFIDGRDSALERGIKSVGWNQFDPALFVTLDNRGADVFHIDSNSSRLLVHIPLALPGCAWKSAQFMSARTLLLTDSLARMCIYYLGDANLLCCGAVSDIRADSIVLLSDGSAAVHIAQLDLANYSSRYF